MSLTSRRRRDDRGSMPGSFISFQSMQRVWHVRFTPDARAETAEQPFPSGRRIHHEVYEEHEGLARKSQWVKATCPLPIVLRKPCSGSPETFVFFVVYPTRRNGGATGAAAWRSTPPQVRLSGRKAKRHNKRPLGRCEPATSHARRLGGSRSSLRWLGTGCARPTCQRWRPE